MLRPRFPYALAAAALLGACTPLGAGPSPSPPPTSYHPSPPAHRGGTAVVGGWESPDTFDPLTAGTDAGVRAAALSFATLWGLDPGLHAYPDLVRRVPTLANGGVKSGPNGMTIDVSLVPGLHWSDGAPITSDDVIFTWHAITDPATGAQVTQGLDRVTSIERRSDTETLWHLDRPYAAYLLFGPAMPLLPAHRLAGIPPSQWGTDRYFRQPDVVSGPFTVAEVAAEARLVFASNPRYADGRSSPGGYGEPAPFTHAPYLGRLVYRLYPSKEALLQGLRGGEVDVAFGLGPEDAGPVSGYGRVRAEVHRGLRDEFLNPNHDVNTATGRAPPWSGDPAVLDALALAVDREALISGPLQGRGTAGRGLYPAALAAWGDPGTHLVRALGAARQKLDADGWTPGPDGVRTKSGRPLEFSLLGTCPTATVAGVLDALKRQWAEVGARVQTDCRGRALFFATFADGGTNATGAFDMTVYSNGWAPDPSAWAPVGRSTDVPTTSAPGGLNWNRCRDARLDADLDRVVATTGDGRLAAARAVEREWLAYHCTIPLFEWPDVRAVAERLHEVTDDPGMAAETWNAADWWTAG